MTVDFYRQSGQSLRKGSTLVAVFWLLSILGLALFSAITLLKFESDLTAAQTQGTRARHYAEMGIAVGANPLVQRDDPLLRQVFEGGSAGFICRIESEADKFDINKIVTNQDPIADDKGWLRELFFDWGMELEDAQNLVDALVDWADANDLEEMNGAEKDYYESLGYTDRPFNRPFYSLEEVRLVRGMDLLEQLNPNWSDWFTVWTQSGIDLNEADATIIGLALDVSVTDAEMIPETVRGPDGIRGTEDDAPFQSVQEALAMLSLPDDQLQQVQHRVAINSPTTRLESTGWSGDVKRQIVLIIRNREGNPTLLERHERIVQ